MLLLTFVIKYNLLVSHNMIVTPINKLQNSKSRIDYLEQVQREREGKQVMWDDTKRNRASIGDLFGFVENGKEVTVRKIVEIHPISDRLPSWSTNVGQTDRNVLYLGSVVTTVLWEDWLSQGGPKKVQGTAHVKTNLLPLLTYLHKK